jgi:plastocyanin
MRAARVFGGVLVGAVVLAATGAAAPTAEITMPGKFYSPGDLDVLLGTTVTWRNADRSTHTVTEDDDLFDSGFVRPGDTFSRTFGKSGTYRFHCTIHRFMRGSVSVFEVVLRGPPDPLLAGRRTFLKGIAPAGADEVVLERLAPGPAEIIARASPGADGSFAFPLRAPEPRSYRARAGTTSSPVVRVRVEPRVNASRADGAIVARAAPSRAGSPVVLQTYDREHFAWVTVAHGRLDARSQAVIPYGPIAREHVRIVILGRGGWSDGASRPLVVGPPA